jgi:ribonucleoside-diphosphate reductase alpha chain
MYGKASFIRKLPASLRTDIKTHGVRNVTLLTQPPTGTTSLLAGVTSGIEPLVCKAYTRKDRISDRTYIHPLIKTFPDNKIPDWFVDVFDLKPKDHLETQAIIQKFTDGAVSKTINLPAKTTANDLSKLLLEYIWELKGVTVYRDGSREKQVIYPMNKTEIKKYIKEASTNLSEEDVECINGKCEI